MSVYEMVNQRILDELQKGCVPWRKPWGEIGVPQNYVSGKEYRGINVLLLGCARVSRPYWMTFLQVKEAGGHVKEGSTAFPVVYFAWKETQKSPSGADRYPILRYYKVFNADQIDGIAFPPVTRRQIEPMAECEKIVSGMPLKPDIQHGGPQAFYSPSRDFVNMPPREIFHEDQGYYATLFHELSHSTGHASRLNRRAKEAVDCHFGSAPYAQEELVAEMSAAFLCAHAHIENVTLTNQAAYINNWLTALRRDQRMLIQAASQAQKAADYILGKQQAQITQLKGAAQAA